MTDQPLIHLVLRDAADGSELARSDVPADDLPEAVDADTRLSFGETTWAVQHAEPAADFRTAGTLTLTLRRIDQVDPNEVLFSLATLCDEVPPAEERGGMHEDDWRQIELVATGLADVVETQFAAIRRIYEEETEFGPDGDLAGFRELHVRDEPAVPLPVGVSRERLLSMLPAGHDTEAGGSFFRSLGPVVLYGRADGDDVSVLGLHFQDAPEPELVAPLRAVLLAFDLTLVDWYRCVRVGPHGLERYLAAETAL